VLALDGWGPVIAEPVQNGSNGSEPELAIGEAPTAVVHRAQTDWRQTIQTSWKRQVAGRRADPQLIRVIIPAAAMLIAVAVTRRLGNAYRASNLIEPDPTPPNRLATLRRSLALSIDPSLTPVEPEPRVWQRWLR